MGTTTDLTQLFLFADLTDAQAEWVRTHAEEQSFPAGCEIVAEGSPSTCFYVLLSGTIAMSKLVGGDAVETNRSSQSGVYFGAIQFYLGEQVDQLYHATVRALTDTVVLALPSEEFSRKFGEWFPMAVHLLNGMQSGGMRARQRVDERERLLALGKLSAGLTHELNNPAAAAGRAADALRDRVAGMRHKLAMIASGKIAGDQLKKLVRSQEEFVKKVRHAPNLSPLEASDREDELGDWLDDAGVADGWELAPVFVAGGLDTGDLDTVRATTDGAALEGALRWLAYTVETESLLREITDATGRISDLVGAAKQYSQMDRAPFQDIDVHEGLDATLVMLGRKLGGDTGIRMVKDYDRTLPRIPAYPAELNQVWTNIIDNALDAMDGSGTLTVATHADDGHVVVEIIDTGPGIPAQVRERIFEPFFTTKPVGRGTGLGLDVSYRVVVGRHHGDIQVESVPGDTRFRVRLPLTERTE